MASLINAVDWGPQLHLASEIRQSTNTFHFDLLLATLMLHPSNIEKYYGIRHIFCMWVFSCREPCNAQIIQYTNQYASLYRNLSY